VVDREEVVAKVGTQFIGPLKSLARFRRKATLSLRAAAMATGSTPAAPSRGRATPSDWFKRARRRWAGVT
jgi:hypothetical protein